MKTFKKLLIGMMLFSLKLIKSKNDKIKALEKLINALTEKANYCVNPNELVEINKSIKILEEEISKLKDEVKRAKVDIPKDIKIRQWYPETIIKYPTKRQYKNNEDIDLKGMKIRFTKYVKEDDEYKMINEDVDYSTFKDETHGWEFKLINILELILKNELFILKNNKILYNMFYI